MASAETVQEVGRPDALLAAAALFLSLDILAAWWLVTPHFRAMYEPFDCCLPRLTEVALSGWFPWGTVVAGLLTTTVALLRIRSSKWRRALLGFVVLGLLTALVTYFSSLYLPVLPAV